MGLAKADIIENLRKDILNVQRKRFSRQSELLDQQLGPIRFAFPGQSFPLAAVHEIISSKQDPSSPAGFICGLLSKLMYNGGVSVWINSHHCIYPPALCAFGLAPERIIFIKSAKQKEILWIIEEALKCDSLAAVVGEVKELDFTASRRLQLAVEESRVTGFVIRPETPLLNTTACLARWRISSLPSSKDNKMPGIGFPGWKVELMKIRNGKPGSWNLQWANNSFHFGEIAAPDLRLHRKTG